MHFRNLKQNLMKMEILNLVLTNAW